MKEDTVLMPLFKEMCPEKVKILESGSVFPNHILSTPEQ